MRQITPAHFFKKTLALTAWFGVLLQLYLSLQLAQTNGKSLAMGVMIYLGFFTVLTNIFVALTLTVPSVAADTRLGRFFSHQLTVFCAAVSIILVGLGYHFLLRHIWNPQGAQWLADMVLHYVVPVLMCAYWLLFAPKAELTWCSPLLAGAYPILYFTYALARGALIGAYPYPFIDVAVIGYALALRNALGLWLVFVVVGWLLLASTKIIAHLPHGLRQ